jgi:hypothetical protein
MFGNQELNNLACEVIETFNRYYIYDSYIIILPDKYYNSLTKSWINENLNIYRYEEHKGDIWNNQFNLLLDGEVKVMFNTEPKTIHDWMDINGDNRDSKSLIKCYSKLRRIFRRYNLEWKTFGWGYRITFKKIKNII